MTEQNKQQTSEPKPTPHGDKRKRNRRRSGGEQPGDQTFDQKLRELVKKYKGFDPWEKEHKSESDIERTVCRHLDTNGIEHKHRTKRFNVVLKGSQAAVFIPDIIIPFPRIENKPILIHTFDASRMDEEVALLRGFKKQIGLKYFLVAVTTKDDLINIPADICDLLVAVEYAASLPSQLRSQAK